MAQLTAAPREHLRAAWGSREGERYWLLLRGHDVPHQPTQRGSIGHSHVLGPELRSLAGARSVLVKLLAKAAMRLRHEGYLAGGMAIQIRFVGLDARFERDLSFAPLDDTPTLLHLLGEQLGALERARRRGRWDPCRHPPLSVAVTLVNLAPAGSVTGALLDTRDRNRRTSAVLDRINRRYGNNALYFGSMQEALAREAAPMRIPFSKIPEVALEEDIASRHHAEARDRDAGRELWWQRERQFKVLAEATHRQTRGRHEAAGSRPPPKAGAGGRQPCQRRARGPAPPSLFS